MYASLATYVRILLLIGSFLGTYAINDNKLAIPEPSVVTIDNVRFYMFIRTRHTYYDAETNCKDIGGELMRFSNDTFNNIFSSIMHERVTLQITPKTTDSFVMSFWINARKISKTWSYEDGTKLQYDNWKQDSTWTPASDANCGEVRVDEGNIGKWRAEQCAEMRSFICEVQPSSISDRKMKSSSSSRNILKNVSIREVMIVEIVILCVLFVLVSVTSSLLCRLTKHEV